MPEQPEAQITSVRERTPSYDVDKYYPHLLDQYRLYVEMADRNSGRRTLVNNSFITLIGAGALAFSAAPKSLDAPALVPFFQLFVSAAGVLMGLLWLETLEYFRHLSGAKFDVILEIEQLLPAQGYAIEWEHFKRRRQKRRHVVLQDLSTMEKCLPALTVFMAAFAVIYAMINCLRAL